MNIEEKLKTVKEKLKAVDTSLTLEEQALIGQNPELVIEYLKACSRNTKYITEESFDFVVETSVGLDDGILTEEEREQLWYNIAYTLFFVVGRYTATLMDEVLSYANVDEETEKRIRNLEAQLLVSETAVVPEIDVDDATINKLLDNKSYRLISQIQATRNDLSEATYARLKKEFPFDKYSLPKIFDREDEPDLKDQIILKLAQAAEKIYKVSHTEGTKPEEIERLRKEFSQKVLLAFTKINDLYGLEDEHSRDFNIIERQMDPESLKEFQLLCFQKNYFGDLWHLHSTHAITEEVLEEKAKELMNMNRRVPSDLYSFLNKSYTHSDEYVNFIVSRGNLSELLGYNSPITDGYDDTLINKVIEEIKKGNPNYDKDIEEVDFNFHHFPQILEAIIETGKVQKISLSCFEANDTFKNLLIKLFKLCPKADLNVSYLKQELPFVDLIIKHFKETKEPHKIAQLVSEVLNNYGIDSNYHDLVDSVMDDYYVADYLIGHANNIIIGNPNYQSCYFKNAHLLNLILEKVNHNEGYYAFYSHEVFEQIKGILASKYNLDLKKLEMMEQAFGPLVIRYIENDNIQSIIKLNEEDFNKLLSLFPKTTFDIKDIQAAYDSLIQNMFAKTNPDVVTIFGTFIQALDQNNIEVINKIKETLVLNTSIEYMAKLLVDYGLPDFNDVNEFINFLIEAYKNDKEGIKKVIHDITNEYILNQRKEFHNTHYMAEKYSGEYYIYDRLLKAIEEGRDIEEFLIRSELTLYLTPAFYAKFTKDKDLPEEYLIPQVLIDTITEKVKFPDKRIKYLTLLKEITDYYISRKMEQHRKELEMGVELELPYALEPKNAENEYYKYLIANSYNFYIYDRENDKYEYLYNVIVDTLVKSGIPKQLVEDCLLYYAHPEQVLDNLEQIRSTLKTVIPTAIRIIREKESTIECDEYRPLALKEGVIEDLDKDNKIQRIYTSDEPDVDVYQILADLNVELLQNNVFNNEELLHKLQTIMQKRKLHLLPSSLKKLVEKCNISSNFTNVSAFINFFAHIYKEEQKLLLASGKDPETALTSLAIILTRADTYSSLSNVYTQVLGSEDAKLIKSNPGPNSACTKIKNNQRLNESIRNTIKCFQRQEVTIPPFDKELNFKDENGNDKSLRVIAGNFTDPSNLTHGERTGACMRIGGVGETLYNFCLNNPNGFHIRFEDPKTNEYISRVSGFRNGNTVFLNELRYSCNDKTYSNMDVVAACKLAAKELIELSKDSACPIENVVIANQYAMREDQDAKIEDLNVTNIKEGLPGFYSDVGSKAIVLATTEGPFVPLKFNKTKVPTYQPCRGKIEQLYSSSNLINKINRVKSLKALLSGIEYEDLEQFEFPNGVLYGVVSDDWYIYLDRDKTLSYDCLDVDPRAKQELDTYLKVIEEMIKNNEIVAKDDEYVL